MWVMENKVCFRLSCWRSFWKKMGRIFFFVCQDRCFEWKKWSLLFNTEADKLYRVIFEWMERGISSAVSFVAYEWVLSKCDDFLERKKRGISSISSIRVENIFRFLFVKGWNEEFHAMGFEMWKGRNDCK